eukprot:scaffold2071_cov56-Phaeocystis_antarctica.AAC.12
MHAPPRLGRKQDGTVFGQLALRRLLSAPDHASGRPSLGPHSANQPLGPCWHPGHIGLVFDTAPCRQLQLLEGVSAGGLGLKDALDGRAHGWLSAPSQASVRPPRSGLTETEHGGGKHGISRCAD